MSRKGGAGNATARGFVELVCEEDDDSPPGEFEVTGKPISPLGSAVPAAGKVDAEHDGATDLELIALHRKGDPNGFEGLVRRYEPRIRGICWQYLRDPQLIDDMTQEAFCRLVASMPQIDATFNIAGWLYRITTNLCLDELRKVTRQKRFCVHDGVAGELATLQLVDEHAEAQPDRAFEQAMTRDMVREAVRRLPVRQRRLLLLREVAGMSHERIADTLQVAPGAVHGVLHRARERFKEQYVLLEGGHPRGGECAKVGFAIENLRRDAVRLDRLKSIERHLGGCSPCRDRYGPPDAIRFGITAN